MLISICVCTYKRNHITTTLDSLAQLVVPDGYQIEVIVVDNDPEKSALNLVETFKNKVNFPVSYSFAEQRNISFARNRCIEKAAGEWIAFLDDDEVADKYWLQHLVSTSDKYSADIVWGQVKSLYYEDTPKWIIKGGFFDRAVYETGTILAKCAANCTLVNRRLIGEQRFDLSYGLTGGEDSEFFNRLHKSGGKIVYSSEALVSEYVSPERLNFTFLKQRRFRIGCTYTKYKTKDMSSTEKLKYFLDTLLKLGISLLSIPILSFRGRAGFYKGLLLAYDKLGKLSYFIFKDVKEIY